MFKKCFDSECCYFDLKPMFIVAKGSNINSRFSQQWEKKKKGRQLKYKEKKEKFYLRKHR